MQPEKIEFDGNIRDMGISSSAVNSDDYEDICINSNDAHAPSSSNDNNRTPNSTENVSEFPVPENPNTNDDDPLSLPDLNIVSGSVSNDTIQDEPCVVVSDSSALVPSVNDDVSSNKDPVVADSVLSVHPKRNARRKVDPDFVYY